MFDFGIFITLLFAIASIFFPTYFTLKKELDDFKYTQHISDETNKKIDNRKQQIFLLKFVSICLIILVLFLYLFPFNLLNNINIELGKYLFKIFPFKDNFFGNNNFIFSFILGTLLSIITQIFPFIILVEFKEDIPKVKFILYVIISLLFFYGLIWLNNFISLYVSYVYLSYESGRIFIIIVTNIFAYMIILAIQLSILMHFLDKLSKNPNSPH